MTVDTIPAATLSDSELVLKFESLGDNCELGILQRKVGVEPLGLFRFAGAPLRHLIRAMQARFEGMADPAHIRIQPENGEYMVKLTKYDFVYHADVKIGEADPELLHRQQSRTLGFLIRKFLEDLESPRKIMVFRQNEPLLADDLTELRLALAAYGPTVLLWVQEARPGHPPNTVIKVDDRLMVGYVTRLALRERVPDLDVGSWLAMLRAAYALSTAALPDAASPDAPKSDTAAPDATSPVAAQPNAAQPDGAEPDGAESDVALSAVPPAPIRTQLRFGKDGNTRAYTGDGWSAPEDGFTWSIGNRSLLTIPNPGPADSFRLEFDVVPFVAPPALQGQFLQVTVNGEPVHVFDPLPRGTVGCSVPGRLLRGRRMVEIALDHPNAATPRAVAGENDDRPLAVAFRSLSLTAN